MVRVNVDNLKEGCIVSKDIFSKTNNPIIKEKTVISKKHLDVLKAFLIEEIDIEPTLVNGEPFSLTKATNDDDLDNKENLDKNRFTKLFLNATRQYKNEFRSWQSGMQVDVTKIRAIIIPLINLMEKESINIFSLHHYSTKDNYIYQHPIAVSLISSYIARKLNYSKGETVQIALAGCLADCGMAKIDENILYKNSALTTLEFNEIKKHPIYSFRMIEKTPLLKDEAKLAIYQHHERLNGSGYPLGERGDKIHPYAKIIAVADVFHAMTSERLYKNKRSAFKVLEMLLSDFFGQFDLSSIQELNNAIMTFSIGSKVQLSDGRVAEIMFIDQKRPSRPLVKIINTDEIINLTTERQIYIQKIVKS